MPEKIPTFTHGLASLRQLSFQELSLKIAGMWLEDEIATDKLRTIIEMAITFDAPLITIRENLYALELFHGPTLAFKDFGARFMARLLGHLVEESDESLTILVATSGDTGSAVASGFYEVPGIRVILLYPSGRISEIQRKQMTTLGGNIVALSIEGTFDDCQKMVKQAFSDQNISSHLRLSSANSINIARLIPQSFYYFWAAAQLNPEHLPIFSVPSGNFGNLTAGIIASRMGLKVARFIAATNQNDVIPEYLETGEFKPRPSVPTLSNAMDVGNPSNFERMRALYQNDSYKINHEIFGASFTDSETRECISKVFTESNYILDPHGAVGYLGLQKYLRTISNTRNMPLIFLETAHPAKFREIVEPAIGRALNLPDRLQSCLKLPEHSVSLANNFDDFRSFLLSL